MTQQGKTLITASLFMLTASLLLASSSAMPQAAWVDDDAVKQLKTTVDFLGKLEKFSVHTLNTFEGIVEPGQKIQLDFAATITVQRPARTRVDRSGETVNQALYYDGRMLTLYDNASNYYAQTAAPGSVEGMSDFARQSLGTVVNSLPQGCAPVAQGGVEYQHCGADYYRAVFQANNLVYVTAQP